VEYYREEEREELWSGNGGALAGLLNKGREEVREVIGGLREKGKAEAQDAEDQASYGRYINKELKDNRIGWIAELSGYELEKAGEGTILTAERRELIGKVTGLDRIDQLSERMCRQLELDKLYFSADGDEASRYEAYRYEGKDGEGAPARDAEYEALTAARGEYLAQTAREQGIRFEVEQYLRNLKKLTQDMAKLKEEEQEQGAELARLMTEYDAYREGEYKGQAEAVEEAYREYNAGVEAVRNAYESLQRARVEQRKRQEIADWAESTYLKGFGENGTAEYRTPKERLSDVAYAYERAAVSVEVLEELVSGTAAEGDEEYQEAMAGYKETARSYYKGLVSAYEAALALAKQQDIVRKLENDEAAARARLLTGNREEAPEPDHELAALDGEGNAVLVYKAEVKKTVLGGIVVGYSLTAVWGQDQGGEEYVEQFGNYFTNRVVTVEKVDEDDLLTQAEADAKEWLDRIGKEGPEYLEQIMIASVYMRACGTEAQQTAWLGNGNNPNSTGDYNLENIPLTALFHGVDIGNQYGKALWKVMFKAYEAVLGREGGERDLAQYLLLKDRNLVSGYEEHEKLALETRALSIVANDVRTERDWNKGMGVGFAAAAAATAVAAAFFQPWLFAVAAALGIVSGTYFFRASVIGEVLTDINSVLNGKTKNKMETTTVFAANYEQWVSVRNWTRNGRY
jgi:hypothetical protein